MIYLCILSCRFKNSVILRLLIFYMPSRSQVSAAAVAVSEVRYPAQVASNRGRVPSTSMVCVYCVIKLFSM